MRATIHLGPRLTIISTDSDGKDTVLMDHMEVHEPVLRVSHRLEEVRSNPALAAALAGADDTAGLPGEVVAINHTDSTITLTYQVRLVAPGSGIGPFRPVL